jgi:DNA repair exonuclease SbcCD ATPase subunit
MVVVSQELTSAQMPGQGLAAELLTVPVLQAALEVGRQGREWLEQRLAERRVEQEDLRGELERLRDALLTRDSAVTALGEQAAVAATQTTQLAEQVAAIGQERDRLARLLEEASQRLADAVRERDTLATERDTLATERDTLSHERESLTREREALSRERESLATELKSVTTELKSVSTEIESLRSRVSAVSAVPTGAATSKAGKAATCALRPSDVRELGRTLELIAQAVGAVQTWTKEAATTDRGSQEAIVALADRLDTLLTPLATLPELQGQIEGLGERLDAIRAGVDAVKQNEVEGRELVAIKRAIVDVGAGLAGLHGELSSLSHFQRSRHREMAVPAALP